MPPIVKSSSPLHQDDPLSASSNNGNNNNDLNAFQRVKSMPFHESNKLPFSSIIFNKHHGGATPGATLGRMNMAVEKVKKSLLKVSLWNLLEMAIYTVFLGIFTAICLLSRDQYAAVAVGSLKDTITEEQFPEATGSAHYMTFKEINTEHHFWQFVENVWVDSIFTPKDISNSTLNRTSTRTGNSVLYDNTILGAVTVRQLRVRNQTCVIPEDLRPYITDCYGRYSVENRDTNSYGPGNQWTWTNDDMLDGVMYWGLYDTYDGSGYVLSVPPTFQSAVDFFAELRQNKWIDRQTRAVFFDVTLFNANLNIFTVVRLLVEFTHAGGLTTSSSFYASTFPTLEREEDYTMRTLQLIFLGLYGFYVLQEVFKVAKHIKTQKTPFFPNYFLDNLWNILDWVNLLIFAASIAFYFYRWNYIHQLFDENKDLHLRVNYVQFWRYAWWSLNERNLSAVNIFLAWAKYFKFTIFIPKLQQLSKTLRLAIRDIFFFLLMFLIIFFGFTLAAYMLFGADLHEFSSVGITMFTLFETLLAGYEFERFWTMNRVMGPLFFVSFIALCYFVLLNMFVAIILDTYATVKQDIANQVVDWSHVAIKTDFMDFKKRLNLKRKEITALQEAFNAVKNETGAEQKPVDLQNLNINEEAKAQLHRFDANNDNQISAEEAKEIEQQLQNEIQKVMNSIEELIEDHNSLTRPEMSGLRTMERSGKMGTMMSRMTKSPTTDDIAKDTLLQKTLISVLNNLETLNDRMTELESGNQQFQRAVREQMGLPQPPSKAFFSEDAIDTSRLSVSQKNAKSLSMSIDIGPRVKSVFSGFQLKPKTKLGDKEASISTANVATVQQTQQQPQLFLQPPVAQTVVVVDMGSSASNMLGVNDSIGKRASDAARSVASEGTIRAIPQIRRISASSVFRDGNSNSNVNSDTKNDNGIP